MSSMAENDMDGADITVLNGLEAVRKRPNMYIGDTGNNGYHHLLWMMLENSFAAALSGYTICVILYKDGKTIEVIDTSPGISSEIVKRYDKSMMEMLPTTLYCGPNKPGTGAGLAIVNALSSELRLVSCWGGKRGEIGFSSGKIIAPLSTDDVAPETHGTAIRFTPDDLIFDSSSLFSSDLIIERVQALLDGLSANLNNLDISFIDEVKDCSVRRFTRSDKA